MTFAAFMAVLLGPVKQYLLANAAAIALKATPLVCFLSVFGVEWLTGSVWARFQLVAVLVAAAVLAAELYGCLPAITSIPTLKPAPKA